MRGKRTILAIDPSNLHSAFVLMDEECRIAKKGIVNNGDIVSMIEELPMDTEMVIEGMQSYGMPVGASVFDTVFQMGVFYRTAILSGIKPKKLFRSAIKTVICGNVRAKDSNIRAALIERFGATGTKLSPNPYFNDSTVKMKKDLWAALAVGVTYLDSPESCKEFV